MAAFPLTLLALAAGAYLLLKVKKEQMGMTLSALAWIIILLSLLNVCRLGVMGWRMHRMHHEMMDGRGMMMHHGMGGMHQWQGGPNCCDGMGGGMMGGGGMNCCSGMNMGGGNCCNSCGMEGKGMGGSCNMMGHDMPAACCMGDSMKGKDGKGACCMGGKTEEKKK